MFKEKRNQYFQQASFLDGDSRELQRQNHYFLSENSDIVDFKEPLSFQVSENGSLFKIGLEEKLGSTRIPIKTTDSIKSEQKTSTQPASNEINFNHQSIQIYKTAYQGTKDDTMQLNINFKTLLVNYFKQLIYANELNAYEHQQVVQFIGRVPSFASLKVLFKEEPRNENLRKIGLGLFSSSECIRRVMSSRCKVKTKAQMLKYIQKIRLNILIPSQTIKWKDVFKFK